MRLGELFKNVGLAVVVLGLAAGLVAMVGGCGDSSVGRAEPSASDGRRAIVQPQLPPLDVEAPQHFQTASFAFG